MKLTLRLSPEIEFKLREQAAALGKPLEDVALEALRNGLVPRSDESELLTKESRLAKFRELMATMPSGNPNADLRRESIYKGRGE